MMPIAAPRFAVGQGLLRYTIKGWEPARVKLVFRRTQAGIWRYLISYRHLPPGKTAVPLEHVYAVDETGGEIRAA